jgi:hypothetical protein
MKASGCKKPVKFSTIASGNTCGATYWTDGKREAPMLPDNPWLRKSPSEGVLFWSDECEEIGSIEGWGSDDEESHPEWEELEFAEEPDEADYLKAIEEGVGDTPEKLRYLHVRLWWAGNDVIRKDPNKELSEEQLHHLGILNTLLSEDDSNQRLMRAEVCRELGKFDETMRLLEYRFPEDYSRAANRIRSFCLKGDSKVACLNEDIDGER